MIKQTLAVPLAGCLLAMACTQAIAAPNPYSNFIVFGDSLNDAGTVYRHGRAGRRDPALYQPYRAGLPGWQRRGLLRSTRHNYWVANSDSPPDQTAASTSAARASQGLPDGNNWAVGGYRTDQILDSITTVSATGERTRPGYLPSNNFRADPNALYYLSGGGNDFLQGRVLSPRPGRRGGRSTGRQRPGSANRRRPVHHGLAAAGPGFDARHQRQSCKQPGISQLSSLVQSATGDTTAGASTPRSSR